jgi:photosystem II stability/assembly factor-like uncharacterized protein
MPSTVRRRRAVDRRPLALVLFVVLLGASVLVGRPTDAGAAGGGRLVAEPVLSASAAGVRQLFGASPNEAPGEVWGVGEAPGERSHIVRYTTAAGWEAVPDPIDPEGHTVALPAESIPLSAGAGRTTPAGGVVTVAEVIGPTGEPSQDLIIRDPGGPLREIPAPTEAIPPEVEAIPPEVEAGQPEIEPVPPEPEPLLLENERLFVGSPKLAAVEEPDGSTGAFVVPDPGKQLNTGVLHYDGAGWHREKICLSALPTCTAPGPGFAVLAVETGGPGQEWMLARRTALRNQGEAIVLLKREEGVWRKQTLGGALGLVYAKSEPVKGTEIVAREKGQPLTVTSNGIWVDANVTVAGQSFNSTIYYDIGEGDPRRGEVTGSWCEPPETMTQAARAELCLFPLPSELPSGEGRSFAWPGTGAEGDFGTRAITGVGQGAMLVFEHGEFRREPLSGNGGSTAGAALTSPEEGWLGPSYHLTREPVPSGLQPWPVPFRRPLLAVVSQPGASIGSISSQALAVGAAGEVARYLPGLGWQPESLLTGSGTRATPNLRGVAWPTPGFAYAVGDEGAMWMWRASTGLWEPDPGSPPNLIRGNFTGIAFNPEDPEQGYAVGKQGLLLEYGKRWTQVQLPAGLSPEINITSIAFAGHEALATWMLQVPSTNSNLAEYIGGLIVNDGSGWRAEETVGTALSEVEKGIRGFAARRVAALPDGGAVVVGLRGAVVEREAAGDPWHAVPGPLLGYPSAVAAVREGGQLRALISVGEAEARGTGSSRHGGSAGEEATDRPQAIGRLAEGQAPLLTEPYPLPRSGSLIRQTATGWQDEEHQAYPQPPEPTDQKSAETHLDLPREPDPILGILVSGEGTEGWVVGGQTGENASKEPVTYIGEGLQTASVERYGPGAAPPANATATPITISEAEATFAVGGGARCEGSCADLVDTGIGPDVWLRAAVARAAAVPGLRGFLYTGGGVSPNLETATLSPSAFGEEEHAYAQRLGAEAGALPVFTAPAATDLFKSSLATFASKFEGFPAPLGVVPATGVTAVSAGERATGNYSYSFDSANSAGSGVVRVIVLDESVAPVSTEKLCWLSAQLAQARLEAKPALVVGNREVGSEAELQSVLVNGTSPACPQGEPGGASAYFFETEGNTVSTLSAGGASIPAYGTGSLGYMKVPDPTRQEFLPASGFLLASVNLIARSPTTNVAPVSVRLIPSIASLAIDARDGTLLRRSQVALFEALARRPIGGATCVHQSGECLNTAPDPYAEIPARCVAGHGFDGRPCSSELAPEYRFTSSRPDIANFVEVDPNSTNPRAAFLDPNGKTVADPTSGLLCAYNAGTTVVTVETGGLAYSATIVVQPGSVAQPCGTVPRTDLPVEQQAVETPPPPIEGEPGLKPSHESPPPPPPPSPIVTHVVPQIIHHVPAPVAHHPVPKPAPSPLAPPYFVNTPVILPIPVIVPPAPPAAAEPAPPTGASPVTQPAVSPEPEEEEEAAFDLVHHAVAVRREPRSAAANAAYRYRSEGAGIPWMLYALPSLVIIAALSSSGIAGRRRRREPEPAFLHLDAKESY